MTLIGTVNYQIQLLGMRASNIGWDKSGKDGKNDKIEQNRQYYVQIVKCVQLRLEINR